MPAALNSTQCGTARQSAVSEIFVVVIPSERGRRTQFACAARRNLSLFLALLFFHAVRNAIPLCISLFFVSRCHPEGGEAKPRDRSSCVSLRFWCCCCFTLSSRAASRTRAMRAEGSLFGLSCGAVCDSSSSHLRHLCFNRRRPTQAHVFCHAEQIPIHLAATPNCFLGGRHFSADKKTGAKRPPLAALFPRAFDFRMVSNLSCGTSEKTEWTTVASD
jgi:hypothetical protein